MKKVAARVNPASSRFYSVQKLFFQNLRGPFLAECLGQRRLADLRCGRPVQAEVVFVLRTGHHGVSFLFTFLHRRGFLHVLCVKGRCRRHCLTGCLHRVLSLLCKYTEERLILKNGDEPMPFETLSQARGREVALHTRKRTQYNGVLHEFDENGNFRVSNTVEYNDGVVLDMGEMVINGINVVLVDIRE